MEAKFKCYRTKPTIIKPKLLHFKKAIYKPNYTPQVIVSWFFFVSSSYDPSEALSFSRTSENKAVQYYSPPCWSVITPTGFDLLLKEPGEVLCGRMESAWGLWRIVHVLQEWYFFVCVQVHQREGEVLFFHNLSLLPHYSLFFPGYRSLPWWSGTNIIILKRAHIYIDVHKLTWASHRR